jgi:NADP-dependent 3-hydroxy acid dehydrogenase YdfG
MSSKIILVVGASSGFGFGLSEALLKKGHIVYAAARRLSLMAPLETLGAHLLEMDVTNEASIQIGVESIIKQHSKIDVVINNAGYGQYGTIELESLEAVKAMYDVNLFGVSRVNNAVLPYMRKQRNGRIIITASLVSNLSLAGVGWYASTKHALRAMIEALRMEVTHLNIKVVQIEPGAVKTGFAEIAVPTINKTNHDGDYAKLMSDFEIFIKKSYDKAPNAQSTIKAMLKAVEKKNPKWVYRTTVDAKFLPKVKQLIGLKVSSKVTLSKIHKK